MESALLVIDVQEGLLAEGPWNASGMLENIRALMAWARESEAPVVLVRDRRVEPGFAVASTLPIEDDEWLIDNSYCDAFLETPLHEWLQSRGIKRLIVCGMQTDYCIDTSCRRAASLGYEVDLVAEAHSTFNDEHLTAEQIVVHHNRILRNLSASTGAVRAVSIDQIRFF